jgi:hypothetical protein
MNKLEKHVWSTLPATTREIIRASERAADLVAVGLGQVRSISIGEVLVWAKHHFCIFAAGVLERLNPAGCLALSGLIDRRVKWLQEEAKKINTSFKKIETKRLDTYLRCDAFGKHQPLERGKQKSAGEFTRVSTHTQLYYHCPKRPY